MKTNTYVLINILQCVSRNKGIIATGGGVIKGLSNPKSLKVESSGGIAPDATYNKLRSVVTRLKYRLYEGVYDSMRRVIYKRRAASVLLRMQFKHSPQMKRRKV